MTRVALTWLLEISRQRIRFADNRFGNLKGENPVALIMDTQVLIMEENQLGFKIKYADFYRN